MFTVDVIEFEWNQLSKPLVEITPGAAARQQAGFDQAPREVGA